MNAAHKLLREGTADCHSRVDAAFGRFDLASREGYSAFLTAQARAFIPIEASLDAAGAREIIGDWDARKRTAAIITDLECLKVHIPKPCSVPKVDDLAAIWGQVYVLEGSRLGGRMLKRAVSSELPTAFLGHELPSGAWRELLDRLDEKLIDPEDRRVALSAARDVFGLFEAAALR